MTIETEIKFPVGDFDHYRERLLELKAVPGPLLFEDNLVFDDENRSLHHNGYLLRLRKGDKITLTFKKPLEKSPFKVMEEYEIEVSDFEKTENILNMLGYMRTFRYQKFRQLFMLQEVLVALDETPIGNFIEIEGKKARIKEMAGLLNLRMECGTSKTYLGLYRDYCRENNLSSADMVFEQES